MRFSRDADLNRRPWYWGDFAGFLVRDGWSVYRQFLQALHQTCLAHLLRRCREMILVAGKGERYFRAPCKPFCKMLWQLRDRREEGQISERGMAVARGRLEARLDRSLQRSYRSPGIGAWLIISFRARRPVHFLNCPGWRPLTGAPDRPSVPWS